MSAPDQRQLFTRYFRASTPVRQIQGRGLGPYLVKSIVVDHGGSVTVSSTEGSGTTFEVTLNHVSSNAFRWSAA
jgi:two-component system OmpR family sensor kinase